jgi:hypothetical protein
VLCKACWRLLNHTLLSGAHPPTNFVVAQSGKSFVLEHVALAVLRTHPRFGVGGADELLVCKLDLDLLRCEQVNA